MKAILVIISAIYFLINFNQAYASITTLIVNEKSGVSTKNYPLTFGHIFKQGDAHGTVSVNIGGIPVPTQCDIKSTYNDGSIRFAVLSLLVPTMPANGSVPLTLESGGVNQNTSALTKSEITATNIDAQILLSSLSDSGYSGNLTADLSTAINDTANLKYWLSGNVVTEVIVEQRLNNSLNALWEVRIYPGTNYKRISHTVENIEANYRGNVSYALEIKQGTPALSSVYTKPEFQHNISSRWRKVFWVGDPPPNVEIRYNLPYLISTDMVPNYDTTLSVPESTIASTYANWLASNHDIMGNGLMNFYFPATGGRQEIGFFPTWTARYLVSMDNRMREIMLNQADITGGCPSHYREFDPTKSFYKKFINIDDRPKVFTTPTYANTSGFDMLGAAIGTQTTNWTIDTAHQASMHFIPYAITGEYYYLQELQYWAAWNLSATNWNTDWGRNLSLGHIRGQIRGWAWALRNVAHAALMSPDGSAEKSYLENKVQNNINFLAVRAAVLPLGNISPQDGSCEGLDARCKEGTSPWMEDFMLLVLNEMDRFGYDTESVVSQFSNFIINRFTHPDFNNFLGSSYRFPTKLSDDSVPDSWALVSDMYLEKDITSWAPVGYTYSYRHIAMSAAAGVTNRTNGLNAYNFIKNNLNCTITMDDDPTWAILPLDSTPTNDTKPIPTIFNIK